MNSRVFILMLTSLISAAVLGEEKKTTNIFTHFLGKKADDSGMPSTVDKPIIPDLREECRAEIAGKYIDLLNSEMHHKSYIESLEAKNGSLIKARLEYIAKLQEIKTVLRKVGFSVQHEQVALGVREKIKLVDRILAEQKLAVVEYKSKYAGVMAARKDIEARLAKVFYMDRYPDNGGFLVKVEYQHRCKEYQFMCPLPRKHREALSQILAGGRTPQACVRYSQMIPIKRRRASP